MTLALTTQPLDEEADVEPLALDEQPYYAPLRDLVGAAGHPFVTITVDPETGETRLTSAGLFLEKIPALLEEAAALFASELVRHQLVTP